MAPAGYRTGTGTYSSHACDATDAEIVWVTDTSDTTATNWPPLEVVEWQEVEPPLDDGREPIPYKWDYTPPKRMLGLESRFYKPPNYMSSRQIYKDKRKARLQA